MTQVGHPNGLMGICGSERFLQGRPLREKANIPTLAAQNAARMGHPAQSR